MLSLAKAPGAVDGSSLLKSTDERSSPFHWTTLRWDFLGLAWVLAAGVLPLLPSLFHGAALGPYDILSGVGLTSTQGGSVHNASQRDLISQFIPWSTLAWTQVHQGNLPLWNPLNGLGVPLAFNWQSGVFSLPALVGYVMPLRLAFTTGVLVTVVVAGSGAYVFARVLRLGVMASTLVGTVFILSGPMFSFLGWADTSVGSWMGWMFAAALLVMRGRRRLLWVCILAITIAMSVYAGHPETTFLILLALALFVMVLLVQQVWRGELWTRALRTACYVGAGGLTGAALSAPLLLPGLQVIYQSGRTNTGNYESITIPDHSLLQFVFQGFDGFPTSSSHWFGSLSYEWTAFYVGVIALALAVLAIGARWRRPEVPALVTIIVVLGTLFLVPSVNSSVGHLPVVGDVLLSYGTLPMAFAVAVLAGIGLDALVRGHAELRVRQWTAASFGGLALMLLALWLFGRGHLPADEASIREASFVWPTVATLLGLLIIVALDRAVRRKQGRTQVIVARSAAAALVLCETVFLVSAALPLWTSSSNPLQTTPAVASLQRTVGSALVGLGASECVTSTFFGGPQPGILPDANLLFNIHELAIYDTVIPNTYFTSWERLTGSEGGDAYFNLFCPAVTTVSTARTFGVEYVLEPDGTSGPAGFVFVGRYGNEDLYRIPGSAPATLVRAGSRAALPPVEATGQPIAVGTSDPATWQMSTNAVAPEVLRLRLTNVPGWHATIDGRSLSLEPYEGVMLQARIPPGRHKIVLQYWPSYLYPWDLARRSCCYGNGRRVAVCMASRTILSCESVRNLLRACFLSRSSGTTSWTGSLLLRTAW